METRIGPTSKTTRWAGYVISGLVIAFMLVDGVMKVVELPTSVQATSQLGYSMTLTREFGVLLLICTALYAFPRTAIVGAILLTAFLGGAVATHVRVGSPLLSHVLFGVYLGLFLWGGLYLRDGRLRALISLRRSQPRE